MSNSDNWHEGGCLCGQVRYRVRGTPVWSASCTCRSCVLATGAPYVAWTGFPPENFEAIEGVAATYRSSPGVRRSFCGRCGTTLFYQDDPANRPFDQSTGEDVFVATATLDDPGLYPPTEVSFWEEHIGWFEIRGELHKNTPGNPSPAYRAFMKQRAPRNNR